MDKQFQVVGIAGSLRAKSCNKGLLRCAQSNMPPNSELIIADISEIPFYNVDLAVKGKPAAVEKLIKDATEADAFVFACPEYNYSMAPALKNALDWLSREPNNSALNGKAAAIMGAGGRMGTCRAQAHLRQVCVYLNIYPVNKPEIYANAFAGGFDADGNVKDEKIIELISAQMSALLELSQALGYKMVFKY